MERKSRPELEILCESEVAGLQELLLQVDDRIRTGDRLDHNQELYQLSYVHRVASQSSVLTATVGGWLGGAGSLSFGRWHGLTLLSARKHGARWLLGRLRLGPPQSVGSRSGGSA
jgi:hypothetical protein